MLAAHAGVALATEDAADRAAAAEAVRDRDQICLAVDFAFAAVGVRVRKVGRTAEHRHYEAGVLDRGANAIEIAGFQAREEAVVHFQAIGVERCGHRDPIEDRHRPLRSDLLDVALWEGGDFGLHVKSDLFQRAFASHCRGCI